MATTVLCRCLWVACATSLLLHRSHWDATVEYVWSAMRNSPIVKHDTFEPVLAVAAFLVWNFSFAALDLLFPFHLKKYRIQASDDMSSWQLGDPLDWQRSASALW